MAGAGFPEPYAFSRRVYKQLRDRRDEFDLVHDNQCLGRGLLGFVRDGWPFVHTLHHPITVDRDLDLARRDVAAAPAHAAPLVRVPRHADGGRAPAAAPPHGVAELEEGHRRPDARRPRHVAHRAGRRRPEAVPADAARASASRAG